MLYHRPHSKNWYCRFEIGGKEIRRSAGTDDRKAALEFEDSLRRAAWREVKLGEKRRTFDEAALRWLEERGEKRALHSDETIIKWFRERLEGRLLTEIDGDLVSELRKQKRAEASAATVNRHMAWLRSVLRAARDEWEWIERFPKIPMYREPKPEPRWITRAQFEKLHAALPTYLARCAAFAVATGLRSGPIQALQWDQVDLRRKFLMVRMSQAKNAKPQRVPLGKAALAVLRTCPRVSPYVFTKNGKQVPREMVNRAWRRACRKAKLPGLRFHDLRHTWASWHVQNGTPLHVLQALGGWSSIQMVQRYGHLAPSDIDRWGRSLG